MGRQLATAVAVFCLLAGIVVVTAQGSPPQSPPTASPVLVSSASPPVPPDASLLWLVPASAASARSSRPLGDLAEGMRLYTEGQAAQALAKFSAPALSKTGLAGYALYYAGLAKMALGQTEPARQSFAALRARQPQGYLAEAAAVKEAEAAASLGDDAAAVGIYEELTRAKTSAPDDMWMRLARAAQAAGNHGEAAKAYLRLYDEFPFSDLSTVAATDIEPFKDLPSVGEPAARYKLELGRAERLFGGKRYAQAQSAFETLKGLAKGDDQELVNLRLAECDYYLRRYRNARDGAHPYIGRASRQAEALFFYLSSLRALDEIDEYLTRSRRLVDQFPTSSWAEDTLNNLATFYILQDRDDKADEVFRELCSRFPRGRWRGARRVEDGLVGLPPRALPRHDHDLRGRGGGLSPRRLPSRVVGLDGQGVRETRREADGRRPLHARDHRLPEHLLRAAGRRPAGRPRRTSGCAHRHRRPRGAGGFAAGAADRRPDPPPDLDGVDDQALDELQYAERVWGETPVTEATRAWIYNRQGDLRRGINTMRRAYPQFMAEGGEKLPVEILKVIFPVDYWQEIRQQAQRHTLDPCLLAALIAQESTFGADARSAANAIGLMQILPSTGRSYARTLRIGRFTPAMLTRPDVNLRLGTAYFADLVKRFGGVHYALASYNAGENRVVEWQARRPGLDREEFIDDIPFPETQNYVKRILGTAEDYRRLYGSVASATSATPKIAPKTPAVQKAGKKKAGGGKRSAAGGRR